MRKKDIPKLVRVSQDTIVNVDEIVEINNYTNSCEFTDWLSLYNANMDSKFEKYYRDNNIDKSKLKPDELIKIEEKMGPKFDAEIRKIIGNKPELYNYSYYISLSNKTAIQISKRGFYHLCNMLGVDPDKRVTNSPSNSAVGDMSIEDIEMEETYNRLK